MKSNGKEVRYYKVVREIHNVERPVFVVFDPRHFKRCRLCLERKIQSRHDD
ncbi:MAG: hypothetical protein ACTSYF_15275 [Promethearchaeota archaeon]